MPVNVCCMSHRANNFGMLFTILVVTLFIEQSYYQDSKEHAYDHNLTCKPTLLKFSTYSLFSSNFKCFVNFENKKNLAIAIMQMNKVYNQYGGMKKKRSSQYPGVMQIFNCCHCS